MGFVDHHEPDATRTGELVGMEGEELGRREHDVARTFAQGLERLTALLGRVLPGEHRARNAERFERLVDMERLIGDQRTQRVHEQARPASQQRLAGGMDLEGKRFAAARRHDGERGCTLRERLEHLALRLVQTAVADKRLDDGSLKRIGVLGGFPLPELPVLLALGLVRLDRLGAFLAVGAYLRIARSVQIADEAHVFGIEARLESRASAGGSNRGEHGFHRTPAPPLVYLHLKRCVDYAVAVHEGFEVGAMEHDARNRMLAV